MNPQIRLPRLLQILHGPIHRIPSAGFRSIDGDDEIGGINQLGQRQSHCIPMAGTGHGAQMGALLQQGKIPVTQLRRPLAGDLLMGQNALEQKGWIVVPQEIDDLSCPQTRTGIRYHIEASIAPPNAEAESAAK